MWKKHGMSGTSLYRAYMAMMKRCYREKDQRYNRYGARGITVCGEWRNDKTKFFEWALSNGYSEGLSLDRIDNDGNYCPENCRWVNSIIQANNRSTNKLVECKGETHTLAEWSRISGVPDNRISWRLKRGWDVEKSIFTPPMTASESGRLSNCIRRGKEKNGRNIISI